MRQLTVELPAADQRWLLEVLLPQGLEIYCRRDGGASRLISAVEEAAGGVLYVAAADVEFARGQLTEAGFGSCLCPYQPPERPEDEVEKAKQAYLRKRKSMYIQWGLIMAVILIYFIIRTYV